MKIGNTKINNFSTGSEREKKRKKKKYINAKMPFKCCNKMNKVIKDAAVNMNAMAYF